MGRPRTGQTPVRSVRIGRVWDQAHAVAEERGERLAVIIERLLRRYIANHERAKKQTEPRESE